MSRNTWNGRNQRNYERYFSDPHDKPGVAPKPNYNSTNSTSSPKHYRGSGMSRRRYYPRRHAILPMLIVVFAVALVVSFANVISKPYDQTQSAFSAFTGNNYEKITSAAVFESGSASQSTCIIDAACIPQYHGYDYVIINDGKPNFTEWDFDNIENQYFSKLDKLGRCGTAFAMLDQSMMPTEKRGNIGNITPSGWVQNKYPGIVDSNPPYLYNRCHLIAHGLTGENANEKNLITGTRYMNVFGMLPWEEQVMRYLDGSQNHVLYRVTPYFEGNELLARGVEMEAYSVEDNGEGVSFHVFVYNIQPGIEIDYKTGRNWKKE